MLPVMYCKGKRPTNSETSSHMHYEWNGSVFCLYGVSLRVSSFIACYETFISLSMHHGIHHLTRMQCRNPVSM